MTWQNFLTTPWHGPNGQNSLTFFSKFPDFSLTWRKFCFSLAFHWHVPTLLIFKLHITAKKVLIYKPSNTPYRFQQFGLHLIRFQWRHLSTRHLQGIPSRPIVHSCPPDNCSQKEWERKFDPQLRKSLQYLINGHLIILLHFMGQILPLTIFYKIRYHIYLPV